MEPQRKKRRYKSYNNFGSDSPIPARTQRYWNAKRVISCPDATVQDENRDATADRHVDIPENALPAPSSIDLDNLNGEFTNGTVVNEWSIHGHCEADHVKNRHHEDSRQNPQRSDEEIDEETAKSEPIGFSCTLNAEETENGDSSDAYSESSSEISPECSDDNSENIPKAPSTSPKYSTEFLIRTLLVMATKLKHNWTYAACEDTLQMQCALSGVPITKTSKYHWKKILDIYSNFMTVHYICDKCHRYIGRQTNNDQYETVNCPHCLENFYPKQNLNGGNIFLYLSLTQQLTEFFETLGHSILISGDRPKHYSVDDIFDGDLYKKNSSSGMISINISLDGVPVFKSSNFSIHPVLCTINELSPKDRRKNVMLCSLWFGQGKPIISEYLTPFVAECRTLYTKGFSYVYEGQTFEKKCRVLVVVCDSVARPTVRYSTQFNGKYGCGLCLHPGEQVPKGKGTVRVYPVAKNGNAYGEGLRTHAHTLEHAKTCEKGIKGRSIMCDIPGFDIIRNLPIDWMHCVSLGVCRQFANMWFDSSHHDEPFYIGHHLSKIDSLLLSFKPSIDVSRTPRKMSDRVHWKAHEWVIFLLFYSIIVMKGLLPLQYLKHWGLLVDGISTLLKTSLMRSEIEYARRQLQTFAVEVEQLYGKQYQSFNVHILTHLSQSVRDWGPLWTHSAFVYEDFNQELLGYVKSSQGVGLQICNSLRIKCAVNRLQNLCLKKLSFFQQSYLDKMFNRKSRPKSTIVIDGAGMLGKPLRQILSRRHFLALQRINVNILDSSVANYYKRAIVDNEIIHSKMYDRVKKRNSYCVLLKNGEIFDVEVFIELEVRDIKKCYVLGRYLQKQNIQLIPNSKLNHLIPLKRYDDLTAVNVQNVKEKIILLETENSDLMVGCIHPNHFELLT